LCSSSDDDNIDLKNTSRGVRDTCSPDLKGACGGFKDTCNPDTVELKGRCGGFKDNFNHDHSDQKAKSETDNDKCNPDELNDVKPDVKELQEKVIKLENEEKARTALVLHSENIPDRVLKDLKKKEGLKIHKGKKFQRLKEGNQAAWKKGVKDGKEINLNQQAIKNTPGEKQKRRGK